MKTRLATLALLVALPAHAWTAKLPPRSGLLPPPPKETVSFTVVPDAVTMPVTGGDDSVTVCVSGLVAGQLVSVNMPMRFDTGTGQATYQRQSTPTFGPEVVCMDFPIDGTVLDLPGQALAVTVPVFVLEPTGAWRQIQGPALVVTGPDAKPVTKQSMYPRPDDCPSPGCPF